jgi:hypothetical protein
MDISEDQESGTVVLALSGKLDATTAKTFEDKILGVINSGAQCRSCPAGVRQQLGKNLLRIAQI